MVAKRQLIRRFVPGGTAKSASDMAAILGKSASISPALSSHPHTPKEDTKSAGQSEEGQHTSSLSLHDYFSQRRKEIGLPASETSGCRGFTLEDQTLFAESQAEQAYSGRRGLGLVRTLRLESFSCAVAFLSHLVLELFSPAPASP